jgi:hypothetical protein
MPPFIKQNAESSSHLFCLTNPALFELGSDNFDKQIRVQNCLIKNHKDVINIGIMFKKCLSKNYDRSTFNLIYSK